LHLAPFYGSTSLIKFFPQAEQNLARYGRAMLTNLPAETTELLIDLCTASGPLANDGDAAVATTASLVKLPSPRLHFAHFVDHMDQFVVFLETIAKRRWGQTVEGETGERNGISVPSDEQGDKADQVAVWNTLLELYLTLPGPPEPKILRNKALKVLQSSTLPYDLNHALILCTTRRFIPGLVLLWEKLGRIIERDYLAGEVIEP